MTLAEPIAEQAPTTADEPPAPIAMLAELTHRCPLKCPYCSNPVALTRRAGELDTDTWRRVFVEAARLGVLQLHLSGGEPLARRDLEDIVAAARAADLYVNLITSGVGLTRARLANLAAAGLDHVQLSIQGADASEADRLGGYRGGHDVKMQVAAWVVEDGLPLTVNAVVHRQNLDRLGDTIALAARLGARRLEVAHVQYTGWALANRAALMPSRAQAEGAAAEVAQAREALAGRLAIDYVPPDYLAKYPKPCMGGWGRMGLNVAPDGTVLPCHAAQTLPLTFETVHDRPLAAIWRDGPAFTAFRGTGWMRDPCRSCERRTRDFGGCRCQAFALTGDAAATDPACIKSPDHVRVAALAEEDAAADPARFRYRGFD